MGLPHQAAWEGDICVLIPLQQGSISFSPEPPDPLSLVQQQADRKCSMCGSRHTNASVRTPLSSQQGLGGAICTARLVLCFPPTRREQGSREDGRF